MIFERIKSRVEEYKLTELLFLKGSRLEFVRGRVAFRRSTNTCRLLSRSRSASFANRRYQFAKKYNKIKNLTNQRLAD